MIVSQTAMCKMPAISIILPFYNEEDNIRNVVYSVLDFFSDKPNTIEIILINDGSVDGTSCIIEELSSSNKKIRVVHHPYNRGYGAALVSGFQAAQYETIVFMDADGQFAISDITKFVSYSDDYDIVIGYRLCRRDRLYRVMVGVLYTKLISLLCGVTVKDINCGFKVFKKSILSKIRIISTGALINAEILVKARRLGCSLKEVGVAHFPRCKGKPKGLNIGVVIRSFCEIRSIFF